MKQKTAAGLCAAAVLLQKLFHSIQHPYQRTEPAVFCCVHRERWADIADACRNAPSFVAPAAALNHPKQTPKCPFFIVFKNPSFRFQNPTKRGENVYRTATPSLWMVYRSRQDVYRHRINQPSSAKYLMVRTIWLV